MSRFDLSFARAQRSYDAMEAPECGPDEPEYGCDGDRRALCQQCGGVGRRWTRYGYLACTCRDGREVCGGCSACEGECMPLEIDE